MGINLIKGLERHYIEEKDSFIYISKNMLTDNILIEEETHFTEDDKVSTLINLKHFNDLDAVHLTIYEGDLLSPIQVYRIVKDIYEIYLDMPLNEFLKAIDELSISTMSAAMQSKEENRLNIMEWIKESFNNITVSGGKK